MPHQIFRSLTDNTANAVTWGEAGDECRVGTGGFVGGGYMHARTVRRQLTAVIRERSIPETG
jgi:hypothetical protein